ncbi:MAG: hypothetical protein HY300_01705 [Verrucomicrobia bacterium]|nr:hypothetical protein [Verrucomicrobiota bacterium]
MSDLHPKSKIKWWQTALFILLAPFLLVVVVLALTLWVISTVCLHAVIWSWWCLRGRDILFVYSDSPIWRDYVESHILPFIGQRAVILNWSQRKRWQLSLAKLAFYHFGNYREFNPMAVVFRPFRLTRKFRFWQPFQDYKHGNAKPLRKMEGEFFGLIGVQRNEPQV